MYSQYDASALAIMEQRQAQETPQARSRRARREGAAAASPMEPEPALELDFPSHAAAHNGASRSRLEVHNEGAASGPTAKPREFGG